MAETLLSMVNGVKHQLRDNEVTTISSSDLSTQAIVELINSAGTDILEGHAWPFNVRHDGLIELPPRITGTTGTTTNGSATVTLPNTLAQLTDMLGGRQIRLVVTDDSTYPNTAFRCSAIEWSGTDWTVTLETPWEGDTDSGTAAFTVFSHEVLLPETVKRVLAVRHEEKDVTLVQESRIFDAAIRMPRAHDQFQDNPDTVTVGGHVQNTTSAHSSVTDGSAATRLGLAVWPPNDTRLFLHYSYVVRYADLSSDTDDWTGVPDSVSDIIKRQAYCLALRSTIQDNPTMAREVEREVQQRLSRTLDQMKRDPNRRDVGHPFHPGRRGRSPWARWNSLEVPSP